MSETASLVVTFLIAAIVYEFLKPKEESQNESNHEDE